jgi:hypothetical protein
MKMLLAIVLACGLSGCSTLLPIGEQGRYGYMALECRYLPPIGAGEKAEKLKH